MLFLSLLMVAGGVFLLYRPPHSVPVWSTEVVGWSGVVFFGLCTIVIAGRIVRNRPSLVVDDEGITCERRRVAWADVGDIGVGTTAGQKFLRIGLHDIDGFLARCSLPSRILGRLNTKLAGTPVSVAASLLPLDVDEVRRRVEERRPHA